MNYRHIYHAGNFADIFKHWVLTMLLDKLCEKPTPFCVVDTHAGIGMYDLNNINAQKTLEQNSGIKKINPKLLAPEFASLARILQELNPTNEITNYPGSPWIIQDFLRSSDRLFASELQPDDFAILQELFKTDKRIKLFKEDGLATMKAVLPPLEGRGLVFIDPPYENVNEFSLLANALEEGIKRFAHGTYAIWFPIKDRQQVRKFYSKVNVLSGGKALCVEIHANATVLNQLNSCGMVIINPPWQIDTKLKSGMPKLLQYLGFNHGTYLVEPCTSVLEHKFFK